MSANTAGDLVDPATGEVLVPAEERQSCEVWTRVMGYYRPISEWNRAKVSEYHDRRMFRVKEQAALAL